ncbi:hypothetical protein ACHAXR_010527 [Thalassiosira sp. AJA248-18]
MSAAANRTQTPRAHSSQTTPNGTSPLPPNGSTKPSPHMTMNGNTPPPPQEQSILGDNSSTNHVASRHTLASVPTINTATVKQRHQSKSSKFDGSNHAVGLSGGSPSDNDAAFCTEIARRSVARAALHLGTEGMEGEALDVLGSVLLDYMDQVGTTISANIEASCRSSAHANAYDALNAVEECTAPAATQLGSVPSFLSTASQTPLPDHSKIKEIQERGWEGLASFLFGPDWFSIPLEGDDAADKSGMEANSLLKNKDGINTLQSNGNKNASATKKPGGKTLLPNRPNSAANSTMATPKAGKGKQLHNMKGNEKTVSFSLERQKSIGGDPALPGDVTGPSNNDGPAARWHAPYLNSVPSFPLVTSTEDIANPHRLQPNTSLSLHDLATEMEACREPPQVKRPRRGSASDQDNKASASTKAARLRDQVADKAMRAALRIPDDVFSTMGTVWGSIHDSSNNKKHASADGGKKPAAKKSAGGDDGKAAATSKVKFDSSSKRPPFPNTGLSEHAANGSTPSQMPSYVPNFLPAFPTDEYSDLTRERLSKSVSTSVVMGDVMSRMHSREKRKAPPPNEGEKAGVSERAVRRSVIGLGKSVGPSYWGSKWLENETTEASGQSAIKSNNSNTGKYLSEVTVAPEEGGSALAAKKSGSGAPQVAPLGRASGSRVRLFSRIFTLRAVEDINSNFAHNSLIYSLQLSKILEGSMNVS